MRIRHRQSAHQLLTASRPTRRRSRAPTDAPIPSPSRGADGAAEATGDPPGATLRTVRKSGPVWIALTPRLRRRRRHVPAIAMNTLARAVMIYMGWSKMREASSAIVATGDVEGGIDLEDAPKYGPLLTRQDAHELCARVRELLRQRNELQEEVSELRETLGMFAVLRDLMADNSPALAHVAGNGHIAHRRVDGDGEGAIALQVMAGDPDDGLDDAPHDDQGAEDLEAMAPGNATGDGPSVEATNPDDNPATDDGPDALQADEDASDVSIIEAISDTASAAMPHANDSHDDPAGNDTVVSFPDDDDAPDAGDVSTVEASNLDTAPSDVHHDDRQEDAGAISAPTPPASLLPAEHDAPVSSGAPSPTPRLAPDGPIDPVEASSTAAPRPPVDAGGKPPAGTLMARILDLIEQSARPKRPWQVQRELDLPRLPSAELSRLVSQHYLVRVKEGCYGIPGRDYGGAASAEGITP
jgi:hypothetical protein